MEARPGLRTGVEPRPAFRILLGDWSFKVECRAMSHSRSWAHILFSRTARLTLLLSSLLIPGNCAAQQNPPRDAPRKPAPESTAEAGTAQQQPSPVKKTSALTHRFWDTQNRWLFAGVAAARTLDGTSTRNFRARGRSEGLLNNEIVDNAPAFATIEFAGTAASLATSYWMHRTGHHKLERWVSYLHIGIGFFGDARNYALKSIHH